MTKPMTTEETMAEGEVAAREVKLEGKPLDDFMKLIERTQDAMRPAEDLSNFLKSQYAKLPEDPRVERVPIGITSGDKLIAPGEVREIWLNPDTQCKPTHLLVTKKSAGAFDLLDMRMANTSYNISGTPIPLETFSIEYFASPDAPKDLYKITNLNLPHATPTNRIGVIVRNTSSKPLPFRAILWARFVPYNW